MSEQTIAEKSLEIRQETQEFANTRGRVANVLDDINETKANKSDVAQSLIDQNQNLQNHINDNDNPHQVTKTQIGLGNVDNTSDLDKPISTAVQQTINAIVNNFNDGLDNKVDKTTTTITAPDAIFKYAYIFDENNNVRRMLAGDLGKNVANSALTSVPGAGLTLGSNWAINTVGFNFTIGGLTDVSNDSTFNSLLTQNSAGRVNRSNGKQVFLNLPSILTASEKEQFGTAWNNQYSNSSINVYSVTPPIVKNDHVVKYLVLGGLNLNVNPVATSVKFIPEGNSLGVGEIDCLGFQTFANGQSMIVTTYGDSLSDGVNYNIVIRTTSPTIQTHRTVTAITVSSLANGVDLSTITWQKKIYNDAVNNGVFGSGGAAQYQSSSTVKAYTNETTIVGALKSSQVINANQDFYLNFDVTVNFTAPSSTIPTHYIGLMPSGTTLDLINTTVANVRIVGRSDSHIRQIHLDNSNIFAATSPSNPDTFNYTIMRRGSTVYFILTKNGVVQNYNKSITNQALSFGLFAANMSVAVTLSTNITELILF